MTKGKLYENSYEPMESNEKVVDVELLDEAKKEFDECYGDNDHPSLFPAWVESWYKKWFGDEK